MVIQRKDSLIRLILCICCILSPCMKCSAETAQELLKASYDLNVDQEDLESVENILLDLQKTYDECQDVEMALKLKYQIGVLNFKAGKYEESSTVFSDIVDDDLAEELFIPSLNMQAHCARFLGDYKTAVGSFERLVKVLKKNDNPGEYETDLLISSWFSLSEIYSADEPAKAIEIYSKIIDYYGDKKRSDDKCMSLRAFKAKLDLLFKEAEYGKYESEIKEFLENNSSFEAFKLELQSKCLMAILKYSRNLSNTYPEKLPVDTILLVRDGKCASDELLSLFEGLDLKYKDVNSQMLLNYHYAWLLDSIDKKRQALEKFSNVIKKSKTLTQESDMLILGEYAKLQSATILGEYGEYKSAIEIASSVRGETEHLKEIKESVKESLAILKREIRVD